MAKKEKSIPVYLPDEKREAVNAAADKARQSKTKWIEGAIDEKLKIDKDG